MGRRMPGSGGRLGCDGDGRSPGDAQRARLLSGGARAAASAPFPPPPGPGLAAAPRDLCRPFASTIEGMQVPRGFFLSPAAPRGGGDDRHSHTGPRASQGFTAPTV
uniref:Uncharacterized protein n=1 Tax=Eutreptiella gymnastica TaxID=73025 RepID=A0A7S1J6L8_9EUGL